MFGRIVYFPRDENEILAHFLLHGSPLLHVLCSLRCPLSVTVASTMSDAQMPHQIGRGLSLHLITAA
jgi:hypothetical protein